MMSCSAQNLEKTFFTYDIASKLSSFFLSAQTSADASRAFSLVIVAKDLSSLAGVVYLSKIELKRSSSSAFYELSAKLFPCKILSSSS